MKRFTQLTITAIASVALVIGTAAAANAAPPSSSGDSSNSQSIRSDLEQLAKTQSPAEIQAIWDAPGPAIGYADDQGNLLAAEATPDSSVSVFSISPIGPGCTTTSACIINTANLHYGYGGTGSLAINVANAQTLQAGTIQTAYTRNSGTVYSVPALKQLVLVTPGTIVKIAR
ncbi:hypothetical protein [Leifsonia sp. WHRI 6310E]|uniref:hypothetical protein n=1 Tax=Leifsonia sp. WHRI 6310E TaxID=3162562 RepID=UPI0032ED60ED